MPSSRSKKMRAIFNELDTNGTGLIRKKDLRLAFEKLGLIAGEEAIRDFVALLDKSGDNKISFEEFSEFILLVPHMKIQFIFDHWMDSRSASSEGDFPFGDPSPPAKKLNPLQLLIAGGIAGAISRTLTAPLDRLKTMFQAGPPAGQPPYSSIVDACNRILREATGWRAFFKGNGTNVLKIAPESAIKFWAFETLKTVVSQDASQISVAERFVAGALAGLTAQTAIYPMEVAKTRLAIAASGEYKGILDCLSSVYRSEGTRALYKGLAPALTGIIPYAGVDLCVFSLLKDSYQARYPDEAPGVFSLLACGAISSTCATFFAYPLVVIRTRLQAQGMPGRPVLYSGMFDCAGKILASEGPKGFYRGIIPNFLKAIPAISSSYVVYEKTKNIMFKYNNS